jgi:hypothetical protein
MKRVIVFPLVAVFMSHLIAENRPALKISISRSGEITADGKPTTLEGLVPLLRDLAAKQGIVWYYSETRKSGAASERAASIERDRRSETTGARIDKA